MHVFRRIQQLLFVSTCTITQVIFFSIVFVIDKADNVVNHVTTNTLALDRPTCQLMLTAMLSREQYTCIHAQEHRLKLCEYN